MRNLFHVNPMPLVKEPDMRLFFLLYPVIGTTLAGIAMVVALTTGLDTVKPIVISAAIGALVGVPVTWIVARKVASI